jgi:Cytochrome c7 and related cytochrome c
MRVLTSLRTWLIVALLCAGGWLVIEALPASPSGTSGPLPAPQGIFSPAHGSVRAAISDFLDRHPAQPAQPIAFPHKVHLARGLQCQVCHTGVDQGPDAAIPSVKFCMSCHLVIAKDRPEIQKMAHYQARGEDIPWVRVYEYSASAHVRFNHAPHIRANVACSSCHGELTQQATAVRAVNLNMGYCLSCHTQRKVSIDCTTCHY